MLQERRIADLHLAEPDDKDVPRHAESPVGLNVVLHLSLELLCPPRVFVAPVAEPLTLPPTHTAPTGCGAG